MKFVDCIGASIRNGKRVHMKNPNDQRRDMLEQLAAEGDAAAVAELWLVYGVDREKALAERF